jgi:sugar-phosphatase
MTDQESTPVGVIEAGLFDLDGLLVDSEPLWHIAEVEVLGSHGVPMTVEMCTQTKGRFVSEAVRYWYER